METSTSPPKCAALSVQSLPLSYLLHIPESQREATWDKGSPRKTPAFSHSQSSWVMRDTVVVHNRCPCVLSADAAFFDVCRGAVSG